jgi:hypothetical protein
LNRRNINKMSILQNNEEKNWRSISRRKSEAGEGHPSGRGAHKGSRVGQSPISWVCSQRSGTSAKPGQNSAKSTAVREREGKLPSRQPAGRRRY